MKVFLKLCIGLLVIFTLTGCIGEEYNFTPPSVTLLSGSMESEELAEANIAWRGPENVPIKKVVSDIATLAKKQPQLYYVAGEDVTMLFEHTDFVTEKLSVSVWKNDQKVELSVTDIDFQLPEEKGDYVLEVNLDTDHGNAQYVGRLNISN